MGRSGSRRWTPGPWIIESREDVEMELDGWGDAICCDVDNEDRYIAEMIGDRPADAHLIAAAPDMAELVQEQADITSGCCYVSEKDWQGAPGGYQDCEHKRSRALLARIETGRDDG